MDFDAPGKLLPTHAVKPISQFETAAEYFARGIALEDDPNSADLAIQAYVTVLDLQPDYGPAHINWAPIYTTASSSFKPRAITARPFSAIRATLSPGSIWAMCSMKPHA